MVLIYDVQRIYSLMKYPFYQNQVKELYYFVKLKNQSFLIGINQNDLLNLHL
jgi:hypothetical protein